MSTDQPLPQAEPTSDRPSAVDAAGVTTFLAGRFGPDVHGIASIGYGEWSRAFAFRHAGAAYVVRFGAHPDDFAKDRLAARFASPDLPIPAVTEVGDAFGGYYAIAERAFGDYLDALDEEPMRATLPSLFAALDAARRVDLSATSGYGGWDETGTGAHPNWRAALLDVANDRPTARVHGWRARLAACPTGCGAFDEAYGVLQDLVAFCPNERHLIHSDLLHYNVLVADGRITAVLDWGCSLYGDFVYDLAWLIYWAPWYPAWAGIDFRAATKRHLAEIGLDVPHLDERLRCYQIHMGLDSQAYNAFRGNWAGVEATARRTLAVAQRSG